MNNKLGLMVLPVAVAFVGGCGENEEGGLETVAAVGQSMAEACGYSLQPTTVAAASTAADPAGDGTETRTGALFGSRAANYFWGAADTAAGANTFVEARTTPSSTRRPGSTPATDRTVARP